MWKRIYAANFAPCVQLLPRWGDHLPPDGCHLVLQLLLAGALITTALAFRKIRAGQLAAAA